MPMETSISPLAPTLDPQRILKASGKNMSADTGKSCTHARSAEDTESLVQNDEMEKHWHLAPTLDPQRILKVDPIAEMAQRDKELAPTLDPQRILKAQTHSHPGVLAL